MINNNDYIEFTKFFDSSTANMLLLDPNTHKIIEANNAAVSIYGYSHMQLISMAIDDINILAPEEIGAEIEKARQQKRVCYCFRHRIP